MLKECLGKPLHKQLHTGDPNCDETYLQSDKQYQLNLNTHTFQVKVTWVVLLYGVVVGYQCFRGPCCLYHFTLQIEAAQISTWHHNPADLNLKHHCCESLKTHMHTFILVIMH